MTATLTTTTTTTTTPKFTAIEIASALAGRTYAWTMIVHAIETKKIDELAHEIRAELARMSLAPSTRKGAGKTLSNYFALIRRAHALGVALAIEGKPRPAGRVEKDCTEQEAPAQDEPAQDEPAQDEPALPAPAQVDEYKYMDRLPLVSPGEAIGDLVAALDEAEVEIMGLMGQLAQAQAQLAQAQAQLAQAQLAQAQALAQAQPQPQPRARAKAKAKA